MNFHSLIIICLISFSSFAQNLEDIDGNIYNTVKIGKQEWMAENLKTTQYNDSTSIILAKSLFSWTANKTGGYAYYSYNKEKYDSTYGAIYNWAAVNTGKLCPSGWRVPSHEDWAVLEKYLAENGHKGSEGAALKDTTGWKNNGNGTDNYGFKAAAGGYISNNGSFNGVESYGYYWTSSKHQILNAWYRRLSKKDGNILQNNIFQLYGFSVRCLKDQK